MHRNLYPQIAALLEYPDHDFSQGLDRLWRELQPSETAGLRDFRSFAAETPLTELQEYYVRTFDVNPLTSLEVSHYVLGDTYKRGQFLAQLREEQEKLGLDGHSELPDYLPLVVQYLARSQDEAARRDLVTLIFLPALAQMERALREGANAYAAPVRLLQQTLMRDFDVAELPRVPVSSEKLLTLSGE